MYTCRYWLLAFLFLAAVACTRKKIKLIPPPDQVPDTTVINPTPVQLDTLSQPAIKTFKGLYTYGDEISTFRDCLTGKVFWLTDSSGKINRLYSSVNRKPAYLHESVYAEIKGYLKGKSSIGYASEYANELVVRSVIKVENKNYTTECYPYEFIALGNEPFWSVEVIPVEGRIVLKDVGQDKVYEFPFVKASVKGDVYTYTLQNSKKDKLQFTISKSQCSDGMSDRQYRYAATAVINGKALKGCAIRKGDQLKDNP